MHLRLLKKCKPLPSQVHDMTTDELLEAFPVTEITPEGEVGNEIIIFMVHAFYSGIPHI